jgi:hypothetical protein
LCDDPGGLGSGCFRRILLVGGRASEGPLTEPTADAPARRRGLLFVPRSCHSFNIAFGGFPAMTSNVPFLMKDVVLLAVSVYLLKQDVQRVVLATVINE